MPNDLPTGRLGRTLASGRTVVKVGGKMLTYYTKRPFLSKDQRAQAREKAALEGARVLFQGLSLLRGTALKMAQQLSLETDLLPEAACRELAKACHQVPPLNRALVRRVVTYNATAPEAALQGSIAAKVTATQTAFEVASDALQIFGANGLTKEYPMEKLLRDTRAMMIADGCNEVLALKGGSLLVNPELL